MNIEEMEAQRRYHLQQAAELDKQIRKQENNRLEFKPNKNYTCKIDGLEVGMLVGACINVPIFSWTMFYSSQQRYRDYRSAQEAFDRIYRDGGTITEWDNPHDMPLYLAEQYKE